MICLTGTPCKMWSIWSQLRGFSLSDFILLRYPPHHHHLLSIPSLSASWDFICLYIRVIKWSNPSLTGRTDGFLQEESSVTLVSPTVVSFCSELSPLEFLPDFGHSPVLSDIFLKILAISRTINPIQPTLQLLKIRTQRYILKHELIFILKKKKRILSVSNRMVQWKELALNRCSNWDYIYDCRQVASSVCFMFLLSENGPFLGILWFWKNSDFFTHSSNEEDWI